MRGHSGSAGRARVPGEHTDESRFGIEDLAALLNDANSLHATLQRLADYTVQAFPVADGAVVRLADRAARAIAGGPAARMADNLHDALGEGPALDALATGEAAYCGSLGAGERWRRFGPRAGRMGLHSVLSLPLSLAGAPIGTITAYSGRKDAFTRRDIDLAQHYALPAAAAIHNARELERSQRQVAELTEALRVRPEIDRAVGVLMSRTGKSDEEALSTLRRASNTRHVKMSDLAHTMVEEAARRARKSRMRRPNRGASE